MPKGIDGADWFDDGIGTERVPGLRPGRRPDDAARRGGTNAIERAAGRDVQRLEIVAAEGTVGHLVARHRQEGEPLALGTEHVNATLDILGRLERRVWLVQPG